MKAIINRLRRLENAAAPAEREQAAVETILAAIAASLTSKLRPPASLQRAALAVARLPTVCCALTNY
jgi:hypothetical protein